MVSAVLSAELEAELETWIIHRVDFQPIHIPGNARIDVHVAKAKVSESKITLSCTFPMMTVVTSG